MLAAAEAATGERPPDIERIPWHDAMNRFGVDKPDLRFGMELVELTDVFAGTGFKAFAGAAAIKGINVPGAAADYGRNQLDKLTDRAKSLGAKGLVWLKATAGGSFDAPVAKFLSEAEAATVVERLGVRRGRPRADRGRRVGGHLRGARSTAQRPRAPAGAPRALPLRVGRGLPDVRRA